jgi:four helix bundle protein
MFTYHRQADAHWLQPLSGGCDMASTFRDLRVWQEAMELAVQVYKSTGTFPRSETYGLAQQMQRAAVSVPSNIAEGKGHRSNKEFVHFLLHARGSLWELQTQILLSEQLTYISKEQGSRLLTIAENVSRALNGLITSMLGSV